MPILWFWFSCYFGWSLQISNKFKINYYVSHHFKLRIKRVGKKHSYPMKVLKLKGKIFFYLLKNNPIYFLPLKSYSIYNLQKSRKFQRTPIFFSFRIIWGLACIPVQRGIFPVGKKSAQKRKAICLSCLCLPFWLIQTKPIFTYI